MKSFAIATAIIAISAAPTFAQAGLSMLQENVANQVTEFIPGEMLNNLTLGQLVLIKSILDSDDDDNTKKQKIELITNR